MILWLRPQILEDRLLPVPFHVIPVLNLTVADGVVHAISWCLHVRERLITNEEVEVFDPSLRREASGLRWHCRASTSRLCSRTASRDGSWEYTDRRGLASMPN